MTTCIKLSSQILAKFRSILKVCSESSLLKNRVGDLYKKFYLIRCRPDGLLLSGIKSKGKNKREAALPVKYPIKAAVAGKAGAAPPTALITWLFNEIIRKG